MKVLIVEDEPAIAAALKAGLATHYTIDLAHTGKLGLSQSVSEHYDLVILDLGLPDVNGVQVCRQIRAANVTTPILVLTGHNELNDKVSALDSGADDYLTKPFHLQELSARMRSLLRRTNISDQTPVLSVADISMNTDERTVERAGTPIVLRRKEFNLLRYMLSHPDRVLTREMILAQVWDGETSSFTNTIDVHIKYLRDKIDAPFQKPLIKTVHGLGYKLEK